MKGRDVKDKLETKALNHRLNIIKDFIKHERRCFNYAIFYTVVVTNI